MKLICVGIIMVWSMGCWPGIAQRLDWKPGDFAPLTCLPWEKTGATVPEVLKEIFQEPDSQVRYEVLAHYLKRVVPVAELGGAFDLCLTFEGTQAPNQIVRLFLPIWTQRDPDAARRKVRDLFEVVVLQGEPLELDAWKRPPVRVVNRAALEASRFWLYGHGASDREEGVGIRDLTPEEKAGLLAEFTSNLAEELDQQPGLVGPGASLLAALKAGPDTLARELRSSRSRGWSLVAVKTALMRWLTLDPAQAAMIVEEHGKIDWRLEEGDSAEVMIPSEEFLMQWSKLDFSAMLIWTEGRRIESGPTGLTARAILMNRVDGALRRRWLNAAAAASDGDRDLTQELITRWSWYDPRGAFEEAVATADDEVIYETALKMVYGGGNTWNKSHFGLGILRELNLKPLLAVLGVEAFDGLMNTWGYTEMEQWLSIDVGEAARFGFRFLAETPEVTCINRENFIKLLTGDDTYASDSDMIDRTLCALRFWAVWKPGEMRKWISTVADDEMRRALIWTLEHPWGRGAAERH